MIIMKSNVLYTVATWALPDMYILMPSYIYYIYGTTQIQRHTHEHVCYYTCLVNFLIPHNLLMSVTLRLGSIVLGNINKVLLVLYICSSN